MLFSSVRLEIELYTSKIVSPIIQDPSIRIGGLKWNVSLGLISLNFNVSTGFVWVWWISVSQFLAMDNIRSCFSFRSNHL